MMQRFLDNIRAACDHSWAVLLSLFVVVFVAVAMIMTLLVVRPEWSVPVVLGLSLVRLIYAGRTGR
jgi:hypothetical protein